MKKFNTKEFIKRSQKIHGDRYDYSLSKYAGSNTKLIIICKEHGQFAQIPSGHLRNKGCPLCAPNKKLSVNEFISKSKKTHNNKYSYYEYEFILSSKKIAITCPKHGDFLQRPNDHMSGQGCPKCGGTKKSTTEEFIIKSKNVHDNLWDYSKFVYVNAKTNGIIICSKHGEFSQNPHDHLNGAGCGKCAHGTLTQEEFLFLAKQKHGDRYDYSLFQYEAHKKKGTIICNIHGKFQQSPMIHLRGRGCYPCAKGYKKYTTEKFIQLSTSRHGNKYDYSKTIYSLSSEPVIIICPVHGQTLQKPNEHLRSRYGCSSCAISNTSKLEGDWLDSFNCPAMIRNKFLKIGTQKFKPDGLDPTTKTIYEFNGDFFHGNPSKFNPEIIHPMIGKTYGELHQKTLDKEKILIDAGYKVISIWESDFIDSQKKKT